MRVGVTSMSCSDICLALPYPNPVTLAAVSPRLKTDFLSSERTCLNYPIIGATLFGTPSFAVP